MNAYDKVQKSTVVKLDIGVKKQFTAVVSRQNATAQKVIKKLHKEAAPDAT